MAHDHRIGLTGQGGTGEPRQKTGGVKLVSLLGRTQLGPPLGRPRPVGGVRRSGHIVAVVPDTGAHVTQRSGQGVTVPLRSQAGRGIGSTFLLAVIGGVGGGVSG